MVVKLYNNEIVLTSDGITQYIKCGECYNVYHDAVGVEYNSLKYVTTLCITNVNGYEVLNITSNNLAIIDFRNS
jgi:hypothetical protein